MGPAGSAPRQRLLPDQSLPLAKGGKSRCPLNPQPALMNCPRSRSSHLLAKGTVRFVRKVGPILRCFSELPAWTTENSGDRKCHIWAVSRIFFFFLSFKLDVPPIQRRKSTRKKGLGHPPSLSSPKFPFLKDCVGQGFRLKSLSRSRQDRGGSEERVLSHPRSFVSRFSSY